VAEQLGVASLSNASPCLMQRPVRHLQSPLAATCFTTRCRSDVGHTDHEGRRILLCLSWLDHPPSRPRVALGWACSLTAEGSLSSLRLGRLLRGWPSWVRDPPASSQLEASTSALLSWGGAEADANDPGSGGALLSLSTETADIRVFMKESTHSSHSRMVAVNRVGIGEIIVMHRAA
jgi:hypothetical protein